MGRIDARLREMQFLAKLDREGVLHVQHVESAGPPLGSPERQMLIAMLQDGYVNGLDSVPGAEEQIKRGYDLEGAHRNLVTDHLRWLRMGQGPVEFRISHKGRVRLSELEQQIKTGRDRDDTGILWAKRHLVTDLAMAILSADKDAPLSVAFLDMNGLTGINNTFGHAAGDEAIQAFFQAAVATLGQSGEAYRNGGDEVVVLLLGVDDERAGKLLDRFVRQLGKDVLALGEKKAPTRLTASCGSVSTTDPNEDAAALIKRADAVLYRAKPKSGPSKLHTGRVSAFAVGDGEVRGHDPATEGEGV